MLSPAGATLVAAISFGMVYSLGCTVVEALVGRRGLCSTDRWFARYRACAVFGARLIPVVSFGVISYAAGLSHMGFLRFLLATVLDMAPATFVYSYLGGHASR